MEQMEDFKSKWLSYGQPYEEWIEKLKKDNPQPKMSVIEVVFANILVHAIEAAQKQNLTEPIAIAAFITGYISSMRMLPNEETPAKYKYEELIKEENN